MRASLLVLLFGAAVAEPFFPAGREYEFDYQGKLMSGIPALDSQFAGLAMSSKVILTSISSNKYQLSMRNVRVVNFNERLEGEDPQNWRTMRHPEPQQVDSQYETILESPIQFNMVNGQISDIQVTENEPEWSVNIKKSLVSLMKVKTPTDQKISQNTVRSQTGALPNIWRVVEQGVDGKCENTYQISEVPQYMITDIFPDMDAQRCEGKKIFQVTKVRDVNKCDQRASYQLNQPGKYQCSTGNCASMWQRSSLVKYVGCGTSIQDMEIQLILNEGELQQDLLAFNTENVVTGTRQILKLVSSRSSSASTPQIQSPRTIEDLLYEYPRNVDLKRPSSSRKEINSFVKQQDQLRNEKNPNNQRFEPTLTEDVLAKLSPDTLIEKIVQRLTQTVQDLKEVEEFEKKQVSNKILSISKVFSLLCTEHMRSLYQKVNALKVAEEDRETMRQLVLEISVMSGTNPSIMFLKELIESEEISPLRAGVAIATIPHYIVTPTIQILDQLFELIKSPVVNKYSIIKTNSQIAFATLLNRVCIDAYRNTRFPVFVYGEFCNAKTSELTTKYIPYLVSQLQSENESERLSTIFAIGALGHDSVIPILMPYIEGKAVKNTAFVQRMAIYSLNAVTQEHRDVLLPIYSALVHNPSEDRNVRIAALSMMLKMQPSTVHFQKLATSTWFEKDNEFHKFVFSTLKTLSEIKISELPAYRQLYQLVLKARSVYHLAKPTPIVISSTLNYFTAEWLRDLQVGYEFQGAYTSVKHMTGVYAKLEYYLEELKFSPIELAFNVEGSGKLIEELLNKLTGGKQNPLDQIHPEWREVIKSLDLQGKKDIPFAANFWGMLFDDVQFSYGLHMENVDPIINKVKKAMSDPSIITGICGKTPINVVKVSNVAPTSILIPSDMGLPIVIDFHMPSVISMKGDINVNCKLGLPSVSMELTQKYSSSFYGYVGTVSPFTKEVIAVGINENWSANYPTKATIELEMGKLKVNFQPTEEGRQANKDIDILAYSVIPFATIKPVVYLDATSIVAHANTKIIKSGNERKTYTSKFGESLGLDMSVELKTESDTPYTQLIMDKVAMAKYNPLNMVMFSWTNTGLRSDSKPSCKYHSFRVVYNPRKSTTNEIDMDLSMALAVQKSGQSPRSVHVQVDSQQDSAMNVQTQELESTNQKHQKIQQLMQTLDIERGVGISTTMNVNFKGAERKNYAFSLTAGQGQRGLNSKWNLHLESKDKWNVCLDGQLKTPQMSTRSVQQLIKDDIEYFYKNNIGFGRTCKESQVSVTGRAGVSEDQKAQAQRSMASQECQRSSSKVEEIKQEMKSQQRESPEQKKLEQELKRQSEQKQDSCKQAFRENAVLDQVKFNVRFSNIPQKVQNYATLVESALKGYLIPYMAGFERSRNTNDEVQVELKFHNQYQTVDMVLSTEQETLTYNNIRVSNKLRNVLPMVANNRLGDEALSRAIGGPVYPQCKIGDSLVKTFDNSTYRYELDDCYHVVVSDCSKEATHAILAKEVDGKKHVQIFTQKSKVTIAPKRSWSESAREYDIAIDGEDVQLERNDRKHILSKESNYRIQRTTDDVIVLQTAYSIITLDGKTIWIDSTQVPRPGQHCGLCGNLDGDRRGDIQTAQGTIVSKPQAAALSFRVQKSCSPLSAEQQELKSQAAAGAKAQIEKSPITKLSQGKLDKCSNMVHSLVKHGSRLCISQSPIVQCGSGCIPRSLINKSVPFTCLPANRARVNELYEEKVRRGEILPELRNMDVTFTAQMEVPASCTHPGL